MPPAAPVPPPRPLPPAKAEIGMIASGPASPTSARVGPFTMPPVANAFIEPATALPTKLPAEVAAPIIPETAPVTFATAARILFTMLEITVKADWIAETIPFHKPLHHLVRSVPQLTKSLYQVSILSLT